MPRPFVTFLLVALLCLLWGSTWIVIKGGLTDLPPFTAAGARFAVAALVMIVVAAFLHRREGGKPPPGWLSLVLGTTNFAASYGIVYWSETRLPSGLVSLLWGVFPMLTALAGHLFLNGERLRRRQWSGFALGLAGIVLLFATDLTLLGAEAPAAALILFLSPLVSVVGTVFVKRYGSDTSSLLLNRNAMLVGAVLLIVVALVFERGIPVRWTGFAIFTVAYLGIAGTVVTFGVYFWLLRYVPAYRLSLIAYVTPAIALSLGWAIGEEPVHWHTLSGALLILLGVALVVGGRMRRKLEAAVPEARVPAPPPVTTDAPRG